jgi:hypothetical protein
VSLRLSTVVIALNKTVFERASSADMAAPQQQQAIPGGNATRTTVQRKRKRFESDVGAIRLIKFRNLAHPFNLPKLLDFWNECNWFFLASA